MVIAGPVGTALGTEALGIALRREAWAKRTAIEAELAGMKADARTTRSRNGGAGRAVTWQSEGGPRPGMRLLLAKKVALVAAAGAAGYGLAEAFGLARAMLVCAGGAAVACGLGAMLLRTSRVGAVTWRNHAAGCLVPWGWRLSRGRLWAAAAVSWAAWTAAGAAAVALRPGAAAGPPAGWVRLGLFAAWAADAAALVYVLGTIRQATPGGRVGTLWKAVAALAALLGASLGLFFGGRAAAALVVGGGPPLAVGGGTGLFLLAVLAHGRNARWN